MRRLVEILVWSALLLVTMGRWPMRAWADSPSAGTEPAMSASAPVDLDSGIVRSTLVPPAPGPATASAPASRQAAEPLSRPTTTATAEDYAVSEIAADAVRMWTDLRRAETDTAEFTYARYRLRDIVADVHGAARVKVALALMDDRADDSVNAAVLEMFAPEPLDIEPLKAMLHDAARSPAEHALLLTYWGLCRQECRDLLAEPAREALAELLAGRVAGMASQNADYMEQRLVVNLCQSVLSRYAQAADVPPMNHLLKAMEDYAKLKPGTCLGASIRGWLDLRKGADPTAQFKEPEQAIRALGHWDPMVRYRAAGYLAWRMEADAKLLDKVWPMLDDSRDEARAAAAMVFAFNRTAGGAKAVKRMVQMLSDDPSAPVQSAAAEALTARADQAAGAVKPLLAACELRRLGYRRTSAIFAVLSHLVGAADGQQKQTMLHLAISGLPDSPRGAMELIKALGPAAKEAAAAILSYRETADRYDRHYIDQHVLPAIEYKPN